MENKNSPGKFLAVQINIVGNSVDTFCSNDEKAVAEWAKTHTVGAKHYVIYRAMLRTRLASHVELDDFDNPPQKPLSI